MCVEMLCTIIFDIDEILDIVQCICEFIIEYIDF